MPLDAWLNGQFVAMDSARVSAFDAGLQHGVGLFETMLARNGRVFRVLEHMERLRASARELELVDTLRAEALCDAVEATLARSGLGDARIRLTLTGGDMNLLARSGAGGAGGAGGRDASALRHDPTILIQVQPPTPYPEAMFEQGVGVRVADSRLNMLDAFAGHKTLWYWPRLRELQTAAGAGLQEAIWFDVANGLACGCVSNVFVVKEGVVRTPVARGEEARGALRSPVLPGVTRAEVLTLAQDLGYAVDRARLDISHLLGADEVFLTNSSWGVLPVVRVEASAIGAGKPGEATRRIRGALLERIAAG
jgi:branched-subunit amino acid aminotransferase/4-amino-4-deoxychorismate lyase